MPDSHTCIRTIFSILLALVILRGLALILHWNFEDIPCLSPNCLSLSRLLWRSFSHPSTNQAQPCLASETRQDWMHSGGVAVSWKSSSIDHFFLYHEDLFFPGFCLFGWFCSHMGGRDSGQIRWESVPITAFWLKFKQQRGLEWVVLRQGASRQGQYKTKSNKSRCLKANLVDT
jgi:hypothetical protein